MTRLLAAAVLVPPVAATLLVVVMAAAESGGAAPLALVPANVAESAAIGYAADTVRRVHAGEDPSRVYPVRAEIISSEVTRATALEAAVWSRQAELVALLDRRGVIADAAARAELACLAADLRADDVVEYLGQEAAAGCVPGAARQRVVARSSGGGQ